MYWQHSIQWSNGKVLRWKLESSLQQIWNFEVSHWTKERKLIFDSIIWLFVLLSNIWISFSKYLQPPRKAIIVMGQRHTTDYYHCVEPSLQFLVCWLSFIITTIVIMITIPMMRIKLMMRRSVYIAISRPSQAGRPVLEQALPVGRSMHCAADQLVAMTMMRTMIMMMMMMISLSQSFKDRHQSQHHFYLKGSVLSDKVQ